MKNLHIAVAALAIILGGVYLYTQRGTLSMSNDEQNNMRPHISTPAAVIEVAPYPNLEWSGGSSEGYVVTISDGQTLPLKGKASVAVRDTEDEDPEIEILGDFETYYYASLIPGGWSRDEVVVSGKTYSGPISESESGGTWSYLKYKDGQLYVIVLSSHTEGAARNDGNFEKTCPCKDTFTVFTGDPLKLN